MRKLKTKKRGKKKTEAKYQIDQSGKIEQTNKDTVLCLANGSLDTILIKAKTKRQLQEIFRRNGQPRNYVLFTFCAGLSILLKRDITIGQVTIDREYFGKEAVIKEILLEMLEKDKNRIDINFDTIGRRVNAHIKGYLVFKGKLKANKNISQDALLQEIKKTEVGNRLKNA